MASTVIDIENLGKCYQIQHAGSGKRKPKYGRLNEDLTQWLKKPFSSFRRDKTNEDADERTENFWAIKNLDLQITQGERVGIIGRNGAGKSTLLKLLSRITLPTTGRMTLNGQLASLLEVGTGFHPELTGKENIFLNGSILGMRREDILKHYDAIVDFSGVEKFLDTPVKRYSSGMQVRLAFSVAAHLNARIMIVDEVLAVGDAKFQKKCIAKMNDIARSSDRTILFVSHLMNTIEALCSRAVYLENGQIKHDSHQVRDVIHTYLAACEDVRLQSEWVNPGDTLENEWFKPLRLNLPSDNSVVRNDDTLVLDMEIDIRKPDPDLLFGIAVFTEENQLVAMSYATDTQPDFTDKLQSGPQTLSCEIPAHFLNEGVHRVELVATLHKCEPFTDLSRCPVAIAFEIREGLSESLYWQQRRPGITAPLFDWSTK